MIGQIKRVTTSTAFTDKEKELASLREDMEAWARLGLGVDEHPARASVRYATGKRITALKYDLVESGRWRMVDNWIE